MNKIWGTQENRTAVRFACEWHDDSGWWFRSHGIGVLEFNELGLMQRRYANIDDLPIRVGPAYSVGRMGSDRTIIRV